MKKIIFFVFYVLIGTHLLGQTLLTEYEYWFDDNYLSKTHVSISPTNTYQLQTAIQCGLINDGLHVFNIRFKDNSGHWSSTVSQYFQKITIPQINNVLVLGEYWLNDNRDDVQTIEIDSTNTFIILEDIDISSTTKATNTVHYRFKDKYGVWSSVYSSNFWRPVEAGFTHIVGLSEVAFTNTSKYTDTYHWDFGDGNTSNQVNPEHTYAEPGAYFVQLTASNAQFEDIASHYVEIEGIRAFSPNKGGNGGFVSINIYGGGLDATTVVKLVKNSETISTHIVYKKEQGVICATFDLTDKNTGFYDVIITINGNEYVFENGFEIEEAGFPEAFAELQGNNIFLPGRWQTYTVNYGNSGNMDIFGALINLIFSDIADVEFLFDLIDTVGGDATNINDPENYVELTSLYGETFNGKMYSVLIPHIPANTNSFFSFRVNVNTSTATKMYVNTGDILNDEYFNTQVEEIESDYIFGYDLTGDFKIKMEAICQLIRNEINESFQNPQTSPKKQFVNFTKLLETSGGFTESQKKSGGTVGSQMGVYAFLNYFQLCSDNSKTAQLNSKHVKIKPCQTKMKEFSGNYNTWHIRVENKRCEEMYLHYYYGISNVKKYIRVSPDREKNVYVGVLLSENIVIVGWGRSPFDGYSQFTHVK